MSDPARVTSIRDVARLAGVSHQTVSRVLNNGPNISPRTRQKVMAVVDEYGFRPNQAARTLSTNRSGAIGVLSFPLRQHGPITSVYALEVAARAAGYRITLTSIEPNDEVSVRNGVAYLLSQAVEALVIVAPQKRVLSIIEDLRISVPFVTLQATEVDPDHGFSVDQIAGARLATRHLIDLGHTNIAHIAGPRDWLEAEARSEGYRREMEESGLISDRAFEGDWSAGSGYAIGLQLLSQPSIPTAVFIANDQMAAGFIHACSTAGVAVPKEMSIVGFDDIPEAAHLLPPLTTVRQDLAEVGRRAIHQLLSELGKALDQPSDLVLPQLVVRESTIPLKSAGVRRSRR